MLYPSSILISFDWISLFDIFQSAHGKNLNKIILWTCPLTFQVCVPISLLAFSSAYWMSLKASQQGLEYQSRYQPMKKSIQVVNIGSIVSAVSVVAGLYGISHIGYLKIWYASNMYQYNPIFKSLLPTITIWYYVIEVVVATFSILQF